MLRPYKKGFSGNVVTADVVLNIEVLTSWALPFENLNSAITWKCKAIKQTRKGVMCNCLFYASPYGKEGKTKNDFAVIMYLTTV